MRTDDERRIPIPAQRIFVAADLRLNAYALARALVVANDVAGLQLRINDVWIFGIDLSTKTVAALSYEPIGVHDAGRVAGARWPTERVIVLGAAKHVIERRGVVGGDVIELGNRKIALKKPICAAVITLIDAAVAADQIVIVIIWIDPDFVIVDVLGSLAQPSQRAATIV